MLLLTRQQANAIDSFIFDRIGVSRASIIERAGLALANKCREIIVREGLSEIPVDVFIGKGMNAQDALVCAQELKKSGLTVTIWSVFMDKDRSGNFKRLIGLCESLDIPILPAQEYRYKSSGLIVDGIFGTAFDITREIKRETIAVFSQISVAKGKGCKILAVDIPSGVMCDTGEAADYSISADETLTFIAPKVGLYSYPGKMYAGKVSIESLELPPAVLELAGVSDAFITAITLEDAKALLPKRPVDGHKGTFGKVAIVGGSKGMAGAACLCARSCLRCGAGLVYLVVPEDIVGLCLLAVPEAITLSSVEAIPDKIDVVIAGPGGGDSQKFMDDVYALIATSHSLILDAQALNILSFDRAKSKTALSGRNCAGLPMAILTPHKGEMDRLMPEGRELDRISLARNASIEYSSVAVLKGAGTVTALPDSRVYINTSGNSSMAKGGSGDVLAGIIGAFLAQGLDNEKATILGVYFHGLCGDIACRKLGEYSSMPSDIIDNIPEGFKVLTDKQIAGV